MPDIIWFFVTGIPTGLGAALGVRIYQVRQWNKPEARKARLEQWLEKKIPELEAPVDWEKFERDLELRLVDDPWADLTGFSVDTERRPKPKFNIVEAGTTKQKYRCPVCHTFTCKHWREERNKERIISALRVPAQQFGTSLHNMGSALDEVGRSDDFIRIKKEWAKRKRERNLRSYKRSYKDRYSDY